MVNMDICRNCEKGKMRAAMDVNQAPNPISVYTLKKNERENGCTFEMDRNLKNGYFTRSSKISFINNHRTSLIEIMEMVNGEVEISKPENCPYYLEHIVTRQGEI